MKDATGATTTLAYDALDRLTDRNAPGGNDYLHIDYYPTTGRLYRLTVNGMHQPLRVHVYR